MKSNYSSNEHLHKYNDEQCLFERMISENNKKPDSLKSSGIYVDCKCKRCKKYSL